METDVGKILDDAADYIDAHGWCQGTLMNSDGAVCARGAMCVVYFNAKACPTIDLAEIFLFEYIRSSNFPGCDDWHDWPQGNNPKLAMRAAALLWKMQHASAMHDGSIAPSKEPSLDIGLEKADQFA